MLVDDPHVPKGLAELDGTWEVVDDWQASLVGCKHTEDRVEINDTYVRLDLLEQLVSVFDKLRIRGAW